jgi:hypothetical protein
MTNKYKWTVRFSILTPVLIIIVLYLWEVDMDRTLQQ